VVVGVKLKQLLRAVLQVLLLLHLLRLANGVKLVRILQVVVLKQFRHLRVVRVVVDGAALKQFHHLQVVLNLSVVALLPPVLAMPPVFSLWLVAVGVNQLKLWVVLRWIHQQVFLGVVLALDRLTMILSRQQKKRQGGRGITRLRADWTSNSESSLSGGRKRVVAPSQPHLLAAAVGLVASVDWDSSNSSAHSRHVDHLLPLA